jgi:hypothetical protein
MRLSSFYQTNLAISSGGENIMGIELLVDAIEIDVVLR